MRLYLIPQSAISQKNKIKVVKVAHFILIPWQGAVRLVITGVVTEDKVDVIKVQSKGSLSMGNARR